jgi:dihydropteroate synthase-like protein
LPPGHRRHVPLPPDCDLILIPGLCEGDLQEITRTCGITAERGPKDLIDIPAYFNVESKREDYGAYSLEIIAEIQNALHLSEDPTAAEGALLERAAYYQAGGADIIDLGVGPAATATTAGGRLAGVGLSVDRAVRLLKESGYRVSVDSMNPDIIRQADAAGADYVLSLNAANLEQGRELRATAVLVPDDDGDVETLWRNAEQMWQWGKDCILDPITQPIGFGFGRSIHDLYRTRSRYPQAQLMMGAHHLSEMTDADTTGINALLAGIAQELDLAFVLTTEVATWARGSVRELDIARRLMYYALREGIPPKRLDDRLLTVKESRLRTLDADELREMQAALTDPNVRIFIDGRQIYAFNADHFVAGTDGQAIFQALGIEDAGHAFYLGQEFSKAELALQLGKNYTQDRPLWWGYLSSEQAG